MKRILTFILACLSFIVLNAQEINQKDNTLLDNLYLSKMIVGTEKLNNEALDKVFTGNFYRISPRFDIGEDETLFSCTSMVMIIKDGKITEMASYATNIGHLLRPGFLLKTEADALIFEAALDVISPINEWNADEKEHLKKDGKWYFVREESFGNKHAYIVTVGPDSKITDINYSREAIKTE